ncbi:MAG: peptidase U32 family protein [Puniceicoccaceae bacterium]
MNAKHPDPRAHSIELMAPAGSWEALTAAIQSGADSVYFGAGNLQMRSRSAAFRVEDIAEVVALAHDRQRKAYLTLNTIIYDSEFAEVDRILNACADTHIDAVIAADPYVLEAARARQVPIHISTQANVCNIAGVRMYATYGDVIVLARELTLDQIESIIREIDRQNVCGPRGEQIQIEVFAHGALCVAVSGRCYMSLAQHATSANRGDCYQMCRRKYTVSDSETGFQYEIDNQWVMSPKDLCTLPVLDRILNAGVRVLKIEGRGRSPDYVHTVVSSYRRAIDAWQARTFDEALVAVEMDHLSSVFNRGFWEGGYYLGEKLDPWTRSSGSKATLTKTYVGKVQTYYQQSGIAQVLLEAGEYQLGIPLLITGRTTGVLEVTPESMQVDDREASVAAQRSVITFPLGERVRANDKVYTLTPSVGS